jgi:hypothetical protein
VCMGVAPLSVGMGIVWHPVCMSEGMMLGCPVCILRVRAWALRSPGWVCAGIAPLNMLMLNPHLCGH